MLRSKRHRPAPAPAAFAVVREGEPAGSLAGAVLAIGNFDGVHRGHQALIAAAREEGRQQGRPSAVLTFEPHPRTVFSPDTPLFRLTPEREKLRVLARLDLDGAFVRGFTRDFAANTARSFVAEFLAGELGASGVVIGHDFHFGRGREGTPDVMESLCREVGLSSLVVPPVGDETGPVSSSGIRAALARGDLAPANAGLGYRWFASGPVLHGEKRGRTLGYPTANMRLPESCGLRHGIYAVRAAGEDGLLKDGVASFGRRPTFDNGAPLLETALFDFAGDLYGRELAVEFAGFIRGEERFESVEALIRRMDEDARLARIILAGDAQSRSMLT